MIRTPLEDWIRARIGVSAAAPLTRNTLDAYQVKMVRDTVAYARLRSPFYRQHLKELQANEIHSLADLARFPFTFPKDLQEDELRFLCVSRGEIERVVT